MSMELLIGILCGLPVGLLLYYLKDHKASLSYDISTVKADMAAIHIKLDKLISSLIPK